MEKISRKLLGLAFLLLAPLTGVSAQDGLVVYPPVKDNDGTTHSQSKQFKVRVREDSLGSQWKDVYAMQTVCKATVQGTSFEGYFGHLANWTHTYVNFESDVDVVVEITNVNGYQFTAAAVHPQRKGAATVSKDGIVTVKLKKDSLLAVDVAYDPEKKLQMDGQDTGKNYSGPPIHTISIFANPRLKGKPAARQPQKDSQLVGGIFYKAPKGRLPNPDEQYTTLYFEPGVHHVGLAFKLRGGCSYYIPGDAIVYGTFNTRHYDPKNHHFTPESSYKRNSSGTGIRIFGTGTLSGAKLKHPEFDPATRKDDEKGKRVTEGDHWYDPIEIFGAKNTHVEGITIADSAQHTINMWGPFEVKEADASSVTWTKVITWRKNGDGINPGGNTKIDNCFLRTQDDSCYVRGRGISNTVFWNDANGSTFALDQVASLGGRGIVVADCDVIYSRAFWNEWAGGRVFNLRGTGRGYNGEPVVFRNINIEDPRPTLQQFFICTMVSEPYSKSGEKSTGDLTSLLFENITIASPSVLKTERQLILGHGDSKITNITFEKVWIRDDPKKPLRLMRQEDFVTNEFVAPFTFK